MEFAGGPGSLLFNPRALWIAWVAPIAAVGLGCSPRAPKEVTAAAHASRAVEQKPLGAVTFALEEGRFGPPIQNFSTDGLQISVASVWSDERTGRTSYLLKWTQGTDLRHKHTFDYQVVILKGVMTHGSESLPGAESKRLGVGGLWYAPAGEAHVDRCLTDECLTLTTTFGPGITEVVSDNK